MFPENKIYLKTKLYCLGLLKKYFASTPKGIEKEEIKQV